MVLREIHPVSFRLEKKKMEGLKDGTGFEYTNQGRVRAKGEFRDRQVAKAADDRYQRDPKKINIVLQVTFF